MHFLLLIEVDVRFLLPTPQKLETLQKKAAEFLCLLSLASL